MKDILKKRWFWLIIVIILVLIISIINIISIIKRFKNNTNTSSLNKDYISKSIIETNKENNNDKIKGFAEDIILRLKNTKQFDSINYNDIAVENDNIVVFYSITYNGYKGQTDLKIKYNKNNKLEGIELYHFDGLEDIIPSKQYSNQKLALTYLEEFDIKKEDFDNSDINHSYDEYVKIIAGISNNYCAYTTSSKNLCIYCSEYSGFKTFSITKE